MSCCCVNVEKSLNLYLSNLIVEFVKLHDLHWNVKGKMFVQVHEYTDRLYNEMAEKFDEVAEKMIMKGGKPVSKMSSYMELASIKELDKDEFEDIEVLQIVAEDLKLLKEQAESVRKELAEADVFTVVAMLEEHIAGYEKDLWFLNSMMK